MSLCSPLYNPPGTLGIETISWAEFRLILQDWNKEFKGS